MFTGIVEEIGRVARVGSQGLTISATVVMSDLALGGSINVNGACLTVVALDQASFAVDVVPETLRRTSLGRLTVGEGVNLERPVAAGGRLDGHIVQGHVDGTGKVERVTDDETGYVVTVRVPAELARYVATKGFVAVDGVSLTIVDCDETSFSVALITYTREHTVVGNRRAGDEVNLEVDILAKYVERLIGGRPE